MPVKIRLMRIGTKKRPFFRVVAVDEQRKRTGGYIELLGTYNPLTEPKEINLKQDLIDKWLKQGAVMSDGFLRIIGKAKQRPARAPKKAQPAAQPSAPASESTPEPAAEPVAEATTEAAIEEAQVADAEAETVATETTPTETETATEGEEKP